jgi:hypothetical protein
LSNGVQPVHRRPLGHAILSYFFVDAGFARGTPHAAPGGFYGSDRSHPISVTSPGNADVDIDLI